MDSPDSLISVGIDIGTTSMHLTLSKLKFSNQAAFSQAPRLSITEREILYESPIFFTPLREDDGSIDADRVAEIIREQYCSAAVTPAQVLSGAVIVTGETARLRRAEAVAHAVADIAGDFVVASAGPNLESVLAARGSGAAKASKDNHKTICNIDIGGGTANAAVYRDGSLIDTACLALGGRFMRLTKDSSCASITEHARALINLCDRSVELHETLTHDRLMDLADLVARQIVAFATQSPLSDPAKASLITDPLRHDYSIDEYWLSGGVAELIERLQKLPPIKNAHRSTASCKKTSMTENQPGMPSSPPQTNWIPYDDMGMYLAAKLIEHLHCHQISYVIPANPIRATVIGAGLHTVQLTGSTISTRSESLPIRNLPLIRPFAGISRQGDDLDAENFNTWVRDVIANYLVQHDMSWQNRALAVVLEEMPRATHAGLSTWAAGLAKAFRSLLGIEPLVLVTHQDIAMALGMLLRKSLPQVETIVLDGVQIEEGDYIDIGRPLNASNANDTPTIALPVVIKSLVFYK